MKTLIVIPARYGSTRLPGKPLKLVGGVSLLARMIKMADMASRVCKADYLVATDHSEIFDHAISLGAKSVMTDPSLPSGSDRCLAALEATNSAADFIINLQGDVPFIPPSYLSDLVNATRMSPADIFTVGLQLGWDDLDCLRSQKKNSPFSGTTCIRSEEGRALWFSKNIIPAMKNEQILRQQLDCSPVIRHVGIYGYRVDALRKYVNLPVSNYESLEGLEQLRAVETGMHVHLSLMQKPRISMSGIDTPEDIARAETLIKAFGDPYLTNEYI